MHHAIAAIDGVALTGDEHVFTLRKKHFLLFPWVVCESEKLQVDWGRRDRNPRAADVRRDSALFFRGQLLHCHRLWRRSIDLSLEDVASLAFVLDVFHST